MRVRVESARVAFGPGGGQGIVVVRRNQDSIPLAITGTVRAGAGEVEMIASFYYNGRHCGEGRRTLVLDMTSGATGDGGAPSPPASSFAGEFGTAVFEPGARPPDMTVRILHRDHDPPGLLGWYVEVPDSQQIAGLPPDRFGEYQMKDDPERWALALFDRFANDDSGNHLARLEGMGEELYRQTPASFQGSYHALYAHHGGPFSIQFVCDEPFVPWEYMRPLRPDGSALPLLLRHHPVARWIPSSPRRTSIAAGGACTIVPNYQQRRTLNPLPAAAIDQASAFARLLSARPVNARKDDVLELFANDDRQPVALLYFAGHGQVDEARLQTALLCLDDGDLEPFEVRRAETELGRRSGTFVFFNACCVGRQGHTLASPGSWPGVFLGKGFRGYLAPISRIWERDGARFAEDFIRRAVEQRMTVGEALLEIRQESQSPTPLAYVYYGDVMTCFDRIVPEVHLE